MENICRKNINQELTLNSPSNILQDSASFKNYFNPVMPVGPKTALEIFLPISFKQKSIQKIFEGVI